KRFLYFKTKKTAGTSVEIYFEPHCLPPGSWRPEHARAETVSAYGIIGSRMHGRSNTDVWFNHMPAVLVREHLGHEIFNAYYKFCVIRNPYDKMVSRFWWNLRHSEDERLALLAAFFLPARNASPMTAMSTASTAKRRWTDSSAMNAFMKTCRRYAAILACLMRRNGSAPTRADSIRGLNISPNTTIWPRASALHRNSIGKSRTSATVRNEKPRHAAGFGFGGPTRI
ncbi:hypothetical protein, partial [Arenimonas sp. GDDSR-1]|uniref:hypothetical protein n=1 Tax=Arenimonas sp. GDDSR-1 TaxID=2950125 RepID=UPI002614C8E2